MSRQQGLRTQLRRREDQITRMRIVFRVLQFESDAQATELLFRLRSKCEVEKTINTKKRLLYRWVNSCSNMTRIDSEQVVATEGLCERTICMSQGSETFIRTNNHLQPTR